MAGASGRNLTHAERWAIVAWLLKRKMQMRNTGSVARFKDYASHFDGQEIAVGPLWS